MCAQKPDGRGGRKTECRERSCKTHAAGLRARGGDVTEGNRLLMQARAGKIVGEMSLARQEEMGSSEDSFGEACALRIHPCRKVERVCPDLGFLLDRGFSKSRHPAGQASVGVIALSWLSTCLIGGKAS